MRKFFIAVCAILTMTAGVGLAQEFTSTPRVAPQPEPPRAPVEQNSNSSWFKKFMAAPNKLQLLNPAAPQQYGSGAQVVVGVNRFQTDEEKPIPILRVDPEIERTQIARLHALRARRDSPKAQAALVEIERRARTTENLMPAILTAVEAFATVGEISDALRRAFGEYQESVVI